MATAFDIRTIRFDADRGFRPNVTLVKSCGTCSHQAFAFLLRSVMLPFPHRPIVCERQF